MCKSKYPDMVYGRATVEYVADKHSKLCTAVEPAPHEGVDYGNVWGRAEVMSFHVSGDGAASFTYAPGTPGAGASTWVPPGNWRNFTQTHDYDVNTRELVPVNVPA